MTPLVYFCHMPLAEGSSPAPAAPSWIRINLGLGFSCARRLPGLPGGAICILLSSQHYYIWSAGRSWQPAEEVLSLSLSLSFLATPGGKNQKGCGGRKKLISCFSFASYKAKFLRKSINRFSSGNGQKKIYHPSIVAGGKTLIKIFTNILNNIHFSTWKKLSIFLLNKNIFSLTFLINVLCLFHFEQGY